MAAGGPAVVAPDLHWDPIPLRAIEDARERLHGVVLRSPLVRLDADKLGIEIFLKLECLQPVRSFKLRGAYNAMAKVGRAGLPDGVWTVSSGNMAQAVAWSARVLGVPATVYVPDSVPRTKLANVLRYGGTPVELPFAKCGRICLSRHHDGAPGRFIHPYSDPDVMAGNGVIGLELLADLPEVDAVVVPFGGGGLICGIASAVKALRPQATIYASEIATGAPFAPSFAAGHPVEVPFTPSFADGISDAFVNPEMLELARQLVDGAIVVDREQTAAAARLVMERNRVIPEGAAATAVAAALTGQAGSGRIACIVSGGNIDAKTLITILQGATPV
jgi:threonine dehydratase